MVNAMRNQSHPRLIQNHFSLSHLLTFTRSNLPASPVFLCDLCGLGLSKGGLKVLEGGWLDLVGVVG
jgi:hypothetical protein